MPLGGANNGEDLRKAAIREPREETGVTSAEFLAEACFNIICIIINLRIYISSQTMNELLFRKFLFKFTGKEEEINLLGDGSEKPDFREWSWRLPEQVVELVSSFYCLILYSKWIRYGINL
ncbi:hypothetical protein PTKIN_Ptkin06aG0069800 [Pterospermum kingtungense]